MLHKNFSIEECFKSVKKVNTHTNTTFLYATKLNDFFAVDEYGTIYAKENAPYDFDEGINISFKCDLNGTQFGVNPKLPHSKSLFNNSMNGEDFMSLLSNHKTLLRQAQYNYISKYLSGVENPTPMPLTNADYYFEFLQWNQSRNHICEPNVRPNELANFEYDKYINISNMPEALTGWISQEKFKEIVKSGLTKLRESLVIDGVEENQKYIPSDWLAKINGLWSLLVARAKKGKIKFIIGPAGTGKSTTVANSLKCNEKNVIVSLSNTIGLMFKKKCSNRKEESVKVDNFSCTAALFALINEKNSRHPDIINRDCIVIDEFSQWGIESIDLLALLLSKNPNAVFKIMGDINQIPTFLSSGSLLYSALTMFRKEFPSLVIEKTEQLRYANSPTYMELVKSMTEDNSVPNKTSIETIKEYYLKQCDCFITGANKHVRELNDKALAAKFDLSLTSVESAKSLSDKVRLVFAKDKNSIVNLIATNTKEIATKAGTVKVLVNERYELIKTQFDLKGAITYYYLKSEVTGNEIAITQRDLDFSFTLGYSITVNKSQGLDWDTVGVVLDPSLDYNLQTFNALYVAATRGKNAMFFLQEPDKDLSVSLLNKYLTAHIKFNNFFSKEN